MKWFILYGVTINIVMVALYWWDKRAAQTQTWRVSEGTLLFFVLLGGSPGAFYASRQFRHKTKKGSFRVRFILIVLLQIVALAVYSISQM